MAHEVFISYSTKDKAVADAVCARLEQDNCRCWYAPRDIMPGADWAGSIIEAIEQSKVMVLIFTDFANESRQVLREINLLQVGTAIEDSCGKRCHQVLFGKSDFLQTGTVLEGIVADGSD